MIRKIIYTAEAGDAGKTIEGYLHRKGYSAGILAALKRDEDGIRLNGKKARMKDRLQHKDTLEVVWREGACSEGIKPAAMELDILYEDEDMLIVNKPAGLAMHPSHNNQDHTLANGVTAMYARKGTPIVYRCINRLDQDTSGLTIIAKNAISAAILGQMVRDKEHGIRRIYLAVTEGIFEKTVGTVDVPLIHVEDQVLRMAPDESGCGKRAVTHYRVLAEGNGCSMVQCELETGRTHQIRVHMAYLGHPILGDSTYRTAAEVSEATEFASGGKESMKKVLSSEEAPSDRTFISRQALHAWKLEFPHPITGERMCFTASLPDDIMEETKMLRKFSGLQQG